MASIFSSEMLTLPTDREHGLFPNLPFPWKLQQLLEDAEMEGKQHIISWENDKVFKVHCPKQFTKEIMPLYFRQTQYASFTRQLYVYGFSRIQIGKQRGGFSHPSFVRGNRVAMLTIVRKVKEQGQEKLMMNALPSKSRINRKKLKNKKGEDIKTLKESTRILDEEDLFPRSAKIPMMMMLGSPIKGLSEIQRTGRQCANSSRETSPMKSSAWSREAQHHIPSKKLNHPMEPIALLLDGPDAYLNVDAIEPLPLLRRFSSICVGRATSITRESSASSSDWIEILLSQTADIYGGNDHGDIMEPRPIEAMMKEKSSCFFWDRLPPNNNDMCRMA